MANNSANYNVNMRFTADTGQAKQQLRDLQSSLDTLMNQIATKNIKFFDVNATKKEIDEASAAVQELKIALDQATNVDTGRLDLSKFSKSLSQSGYTLQDFATHLENLGPTGDKAFVALAQSVINAEVPLKRTNALLDNFKKTIANTARWQISSNLMHGVQGSIQKAYYYAEDLNKSLNNIRIVTGQNNDQMAQFAERANKAAQALSTTTTNYTNASLIYYQQGLSDKEVADRTEVTIKMANAAGESASKVSDQLTAVWNNFYDGSKSLEYYADVMTKLGAYTASSTDEISEGIQKFASVANTIGLSYEYATSALATLTAKTRESANTVGNSLKTLFARIQGLTLGETLEDGTDLNKYSLALEKVGISIKDQQGELKDMNTILDEMMNKWDSLSRAEQVALAQTVGGVRQYTQLVNLMENKDYFKELVGVAKNSEGTLQEQADIYAESWEASKKRVQASLEEIYKQLVNDKFFIGLNDTLSDTLNITSKLIDSLGGLPGVLGVISSLMLKSFGPDIVNNMQRMASNLFIDSGAAQNQAAVMKQQIIKQLQGWNETEGSLPIEWQASTSFQNSTLVEAATQSYDLQMATERLTETDKQRLLVLKQISDKYAEIAYNARVSLEQADANAINVRRDSLNQIRALPGDSGGAAGVSMASGEIDSAAFLRDQYVDFMNSNIDNFSDQELINKIGYLNLMGDSYESLNNHINQYSKATDEASRKTIGTSIRNDLKELQHQYGQTGTTLQMLNQFTDNYIDIQEEEGLISREQAIIMKRVTAALNQVTIARTEDERSVKQYKNAVELFNSELSKSQGAVMTFSQGIVSGAQGISQFTIGINSIRSAIQALNNEDLTFGEKVLQMTTSISFAIPSIINGFTNLQKSIQSINSSKGLIGTNILQLITGLNEIKGANLAVELQKLSAASNTSGLRFKALKAMTDAYNASIQGAQIGTNGLTQAMAEQAAGTAALKAGIKAVAGSLGIYIAIAAAVAAVIAGIVHLNEVAKTKTLESQLARSEEAAANFEKQLEKTKSKAEELKNVFNNYSDVKKALDDCTVGTEKWRKKLQESNDVILEILDKYPELKNIEGAWGKNSNGELWINEDAFNQVEDIYSQREEALRYAVDYQKNKTNQLKNKQAIESFGDSIFSSFSTASEGYKEINNLTYEKMAQLIGSNINQFNGITNETEVSSVLTKILKENGVIIQANSGQFDENNNPIYVDAIADFVDAFVINSEDIVSNISSLAEAIKDNTDASLQASQESQVYSNLVEKYGEKNVSEDQANITTKYVNQAIADRAAEMNQGDTFHWEYTDAKGQKQTQVIGQTGVNVGNKGLDDLWETYLKAVGLDPTKNKLLANSVQGVGANKAFYYTDENNEEQHISFEEVANTLATIEIYANELGNSYQKAINLITSLNDWEVEPIKGEKKNVGKGIAEFIGNGNLTGLNESELNDYLIGIQNLTKSEFNDFFAQQFFDQDYDLLSEEQQTQLIEKMRNLGIDSYDAFIEGQRTEIENQQNAIEKIYNDNFLKYILSKDSNKDIKETLSYFGNYTYELQSEISSMLKDAFSSAGFEGIQALTQAINEAGENLTLEQLNQIQDAFKKSTSVDDFIQQLKKLGITTDNGVEAWTNYYNIMTKVGNNLPISQFEDFRQVLSDIINLMNGEVGSVIDQEKIDELEKLGLDWKKYFVQTGPDEYTQTQKYTTEDKNKILGSTISQMEENGQYAEQNEDRILNKTTIDDKTLSEWVSTLTAAGAEQASGDVISRIAMAFGGVDNLAKFTGIDADQFDSKVFEQMDATNQGNLIQAIINAFASNKEYINDIQSARQEAYSSANSVKEISQMDGFNIGDETSQKGLRAWAANNQDIEGVAESLNKLNLELEKAEDDPIKAKKAYEEFFKSLRDAEVKEAVNEIKDIKKNIQDLEKDGKDSTSEINKLYTKVKDLFNLNDSDLEKNKGLVDKFLFGNEEESQNAGEELEKIKQQGKDMGIAYGKAIIGAAQSVANTHIDFSQMQADAVSQFNQIKSMLEQDSQFQLTGQMSIDTSQAIGALAPVDGTIQEMCGYVNALGRVGIHFNTAQLKQLFSTMAKIQQLMQQGPGGAMQAAALSNQLQNNISVWAQNSKVPRSDRDYSTTVNGDPGGGGGGGSESKSANDIGKEIQDELLKTKEKKRDRLEALREGANPEDSAKYIQEEIKLLEEEQDILEDQIKSWKKLLKLKVEEFNKEHPEFEIKLTDDGEIANASELWGKVWAQYQKNLEDGMSEEDLNEWFTKLKDSLDGPMGIQQNIDENVALIAQKEKEAAELELEAITKQIDWKVKQIDFQIKRLNYYQEKLLKQAHGNKQTIEAMLEGFAYQEQEMLQLFDKGATLRDGIDQLNAAKAKYPGYEQMFDEQILEYQSDLIDVNEAILDLRNDIEDLVQNVLDLALDEIDKQIERLDTYTSMLDHLNNIIDLSGRSMLDMGLKTQIGATKVETMLGKMKSLKGQMDGLTKATKEAQAALADRQADGDTSSVKFWENQVEVLKQETEKASDEFLASWEETLEAAQDLFEMRVEMAVNILSNALSPFETLEDFQDKYEKAKTVNEEYLDDAERLYELNKLNRQLNLQLADANDLLAKQKLRDIQQEIHDLQADGVKMSQYDLEYLQKKYDLQLAEIALMEQQNSKTSMRLVRDAAGNWTYAYDADEEKIEDATQKYEDAVHELGQLSKDYINDVSEQLIQNQIDFKEALQDLDKNSADYSNQLLSLQEYYVERQRYLLDELNKGVVNSGLTFHDTLYGQMTDLYDYNDAYMQFVNNSNTTITELQTNYKDWQKVVETAMGVAGTSWDNFGTDMGGTLDSLEEHIQKLCDEIEELVNVLMGYISQSIGMVLDWEQKYSKRTDEELAKNEAYIDGNFVGGGGGGGYGDVDMQTDFTALAQRWAAGERNLTNYNGTKTYNSLEEIKADLDKKLDAFEKGADILFQGSGEAFDDEAYESVYNNIYQGTYKRNGNNYGMRSYPNATSNSIVDKASNYLGVRYRWGGTDAGYGLDCSGLVYNALNDAGIPVPRTTAQGYRDMSKAIKESSVKPGDLVFFGYGNTVDHVGIYAGNGQMIDAPGAKVQYTNIDEKRDRLLGYGRLGNTNYSSSDTAALMDRLGLSRRGGAASGAYTGDWGPGQGIGIDNGKIIKVHPKELILNKSDTRNILRAVDIVRNMNDWVDKQVQQMSSISSSKLDSLFNSAIPRYETQPIKQEVTIQADFPGVTDHYEIEEALSNLSNNAAQYISANRSK